MTSHFKPPGIDGVSMHDIALWNAIVSHGGQELALPTPGASAVVTLAGEPAGDVPIALFQPADGPLLAAAVHSYPFEQQLGVELEVADLAILPLELRDAVLAGMAALLSRVALSHRLGDMELRRVGPLADLLGARERAGTGWWSVTINGLAAEPARLTIGCAREALIALARQDGLAPRRNWAGLRQRIPVDGYLTLGRLRVPLEDAARLAPGTLVVMPWMEPGIVGVRFEQVLFQLREAAGGMACARVEALDTGAAVAVRTGTGADRMTTDIDASLAGVVPTLEIALDFDLGRVTVPLADMESWAPGSIVPLQPMAAEAGVEVTIRANGRAVGIGDLVRIDDRVAVRLTRITLPA